MKFYCAIFFTLSSLLTSAQSYDTFYDYAWKTCDASHASFFTSLEQTDSGWFRNDYFISTQKLQMSALYKDSACKIMNGYVAYFYANGSVEALGLKLNNKREGIYIHWHSNGMMADSAMYHDDKIVDEQSAWHPNGITADSMKRINDSTIVVANWFDNGNVSSTGYMVNGRKKGKWNYFHKNGKPAAVEINENGKPVNVEYFKEDGTLLTDTANNTKDASFKGGHEKWVKYLTEKIYWPSNYVLKNTDKVTVVVNFTVNEEGRIEDAFVSVPFHELFNKIALDVINRSPAWLPRLDHNRKVKVRMRQPMTFLQETE